MTFEQHRRRLKRQNLQATCSMSYKSPNSGKRAPCLLSGACYRFRIDRNLSFPLFARRLDEKPAKSIFAHIRADFRPSWGWSEPRLGFLSLSRSSTFFWLKKQKLWLYWAKIDKLGKSVHINCASDYTQLKKS